MSTLTSSPYNLVLGESIFAQVIACNVYGCSPISSAGNGGVIVLVPNAPVNLVNDPVTTSAYTIRFTWNQGSSDGGTPVIDYAIYYD